MHQVSNARPFSAVFSLMVFRCPTECRLSRKDQPWTCVISLSFILDENGQKLGKLRKEQFGDPIFDKAEVEERIRRAQRAILNPTIPVRQLLNGSNEDIEEPDLTFSRNYVSLEISGADVDDLSFCDLPGTLCILR